VTTKETRYKRYIQKSEQNSAAPTGMTGTGTRSFFPET
jgi:hypothetical protein